MKLFAVFLTLVLSVAPLAQAEVSYFSPATWNPEYEPLNKYPSYILPHDIRDNRYEDVRRYLRRMRATPALHGFVPFEEWGAMALVYPTRALPRVSPKKRVLVLANRLDDHVAHSKHLAEILPQLHDMGLEPHVLPVAALARLNADERKNFYRVLGAHFSMLVALGGADLDYRLYDTENRGSVNFNGERDFWEIDVVRGIYQHTNMLILGICRGAQLIAVAFGCKMDQEIANVKEYDLKQPYQGNIKQSVYLFPTKNNILQFLAQIPQSAIPRPLVLVSDHHQGWVIPPDHPMFQVSARTIEGVPKFFESYDGRIIGSQNHIERDADGDGGTVLRNCTLLLSP